MCGSEDVRKEKKDKPEDRFKMEKRKTSLMDLDDLLDEVMWKSTLGKISASNRGCGASRWQHWKGVPALNPGPESQCLLNYPWNPKPTLIELLGRLNEVQKV